MRTVLGLFDNLTEAQRTIQELVQLGFAADSIGIVTSTASQRALESDPRVNLRLMDVNDVGRVAAAGPLRDALAAGNGGANLSATLRRYGLEGELAERYVAGVRKGETLEAIIVHDQDSTRAYEVMRRHSHVPQGYGGAVAGAGLAGSRVTEQQRADANREARLREERLREERLREQQRAQVHQFGEETRTIPIVREELKVGKREVETGALRANVHIVERPVTNDVNLREEHIVIERRAVDRPLRGDENVFRNDQIEMHEYAEQPIIAKEARIVEEVVIHKTVREHVERIADKIRNTELEFERPFDASMYRKHFEGLGLRGERFEDYAPAYRLGHELRGDARLKGSRWEDVEPGVRQSWESRNPGTWEKFKETIRHAWTSR
jgi:uncharacterized protein (TIGR02271 family)